MKTLSSCYSCFSLIHTPTRRQMSFEIPFVLKNSRNVVCIYVRMLFFNEIQFHQLFENVKSETTYIVFSL